MTQNVRLQNLRDFTVQIRNADDQIVGTGIAVSTNGKIVTCAHVVEKAIGSHPRKANGAEVGVYFPQARGGDEKKHRATVDKCFPHHDDDIVLLQITGNTSPLAPEQIAILGLADNSEGNPFRTYGYSPLGIYPAKRGEGIIKGSIEPPPNRNLQVDPIQLESNDIAEGMSGAGVLDANRNLVVGLVAERYYTEDNDNNDIGFGVDSKVLTFDPFDFEIRGEALGLRPAPEFRLDKDLLEQAIEIGKYILTHRPLDEKFAWHNAPAVLTEWTGREHLLEQITSDWNDSTKHVTGLIGFGGEGKSSLARKWVETLLSPLSLGVGSGVRSKPDGVFWWGFYENRSVDEFLEAALKYMSGGRIDPRQVQSSNMRAQIIGAMLGTGRYLFILDGLEVMQHQEGDQYGLTHSNDLRDLLTFFARPDNQSFCLITSRAPLLNLMEYTTYTHRDVDRLSEDDGRDLLKKLGVKGGDSELNKVVADWDGHVLTLSILAAYLAERYEGDIHHLADIPIPTAEEPRYERVHRVLRRYDEHFTEAKKVFLKIFSLFRMPITRLEFNTVFRTSLNKKPGFLNRLFGMKNKSAISPADSFNTLLVEMDYSSFYTIIQELMDVRILRYDEEQDKYTVHPLVRTYYFGIFKLTNPVEAIAFNRAIKDHYIEIGLHNTHLRKDGVIVRTIGFNPPLTLERLNPFIEAVHHACNATMYEEGLNLYYKYLRKLSDIGFQDTEISLLSEFFQNGNLFKEPLVISSESQSFIFSQLGYCLTEVGRMQDALRIYERAFFVKSKFGENKDPLIGTPEEYINLAITYYYLGKINSMAQNAQKALDKAQLTKNEGRVVSGLAWLAWADYLRGNLSESGITFKKAEKLDQKIDGYKYLYSLRGIYHADYLHRFGDIAYARRVTKANQKISTQNHWAILISLCNRVLGDLDSSEGYHNFARAHYASALNNARNIQNRGVLIEVLLARGRWLAKYMEDANRAFNDLNEALVYCVESGYRIYEADVRVALAWAYLANGKTEKAKQSAERAMQMSNEMGYHWGKVDAEEVLERIESSEQKVGKEKRTTKTAKQTKKKSSRS